MPDPSNRRRRGTANRIPHRSVLSAAVGLILVASISWGMVADPAPPPASSSKTPAPKKERTGGTRTPTKEKAGEEVTLEGIDAAVQKAVAFIYSQQKPDGRWEQADRRVGDAHDWEKMQGDTFGGFSALATYALLTAGEKPDDKRMASAISFLEKADMVGVYSLGLRAQVWHLLSRSPKNKDEMERLATADANRLVSNINTEGENRGLWDYGTGKGKRIDHSVSQYGILGLWALQDAGAKVDIRYWHVFDERWRADQFPDGGWGYDSTPKYKGTRPGPSATMTAAGIATLFITQGNTYTDLPEHHSNVFNSNIENGLRWMAKHFNEIDNNYGWYGVQRIGVASGTKYFGTIDWFQHGAAHLIGTQEANGSWRPSLGTPLTDTCFAVLFLARGRAPIIMNKLQYDIAAKAGKPEEADWNQRPRDAANLCQWTSDRLEGNFNWQLVNLQVSPEALRDAPILYLAGDQALNFTEAEKDKLNIFVHEGGMIVANADYNNKAFSDSVMELGTELFGYEFRDLESTSPIWAENGRVARSGNTKVLALGNGIRELMILFNIGDPARVWQSLPINPKSEPMEIGANLFLYAVDKKNLESRGESTLVLPNFGITTDRKITVARLKYGGNWDPEPGGWWHLAAMFHNDLHVDLEVKPVLLGSGALTAAPASAAPVHRPSASEIHKLAFKRIPPDQVQATDGDTDKLNALIQPKIAEIEGELAAAEAARLASLATIKVAHLTGTTQFTLSDEQFEELRKFVSGGGTLVIDSGGGSAAFSNSAEELLKKLLPDAAGKSLQLPLPPDDPLYTLAGHPITEFAYRTFAKTVVGNLRSARVFGIPVNGRIAVYYSPEDISAGLVGQATDGIVGYTPDTATEIMRNIILASVPATTKNR
jgi:hypothetical protein